jgi:hypothetical protein
VSESQIEDFGIYKIIARVYAISGDHDSFYFQIDDQPEDIWDLNPTGTPSEFYIWREDEVTKRGIGTYDSPRKNPYTIELTQGTHTITFRGREPEAKLDYFYFSKISGTPLSYQCSDGLDNDGDGLTDYPDDPGCSSASDNDEYNSPPSDHTPPSPPTGLRLYFSN